MFDNSRMIEEANGEENTHEVVQEPESVFESDAVDTESDINTEPTAEVSEDEQPEPEQKPEVHKSESKERQRYQRKMQEYKKKSEQLEAAAKTLAEENLELRKYVDGYGQAASHHYGEKLKLKIEQVQQKLEESELNGDVKAKTEAIRELAKLAEQEAYLERYNYQNAQQHSQNQRANHNPQQEAQPDIQDIPDEVEDWFDEHPWLDQRRREFNPDMRDEVYAYSQALANRWKRTGKGNQIDSPVFLEEVGKYVKDNFPEYYSTNRRPPLSNNNREVNTVPVRKQPSTKSQAPKFTAEEREWMGHFGMTEEQWDKRRKEVASKTYGKA